MKKSVLTGAVSVLMAAALAFGAPAALAAEPLDLETPNTLTVQLKDEYAKDLAKAAPAEGEETEGKDPLTAPAVVDLYRVADAEKIPGVDGYTYKFGADFEALANTFSKDIEGLTPADQQELKATAWLDLAQQAAALLFPETAKEKPALEPAFADKELGAIGELPAGLYLIVPHGKGLTPEQYVERIPGKGPEAAETVVTKAFSDLYEYSFTPYLVSLPGRAVAADVNGDTTGGDTSDGNGWSHAVTSVLKVSQEPRYGQLRIRKSINAYEDGKPATFVFEIKAVKGEGEDAETVYSNVVGLTFDGSKSQEVTLDRIPAGSTVTVTEVYSGAAYTADVPVREDLVITAEETAEAVFSNTHNDRNGGGYGANNHYEFTDRAGFPAWEYASPEGGAEA